MGQTYGFGFSDGVLAEAAGVPTKALHFDVNAICAAYDAIVPVAERLGVSVPRPRLAGFAYPHVASLGAEVVFAEDGEPNAKPLLGSREEIDSLREPDDYLAAPLIQSRIELYERLKDRRPDASPTIGHPLEGPVTTAMLLLGQDFLILPYDEPDRAHRLLEFSVSSALNYARAIWERLGVEARPGPKGFPDDFAGMFPPTVFASFVIPYWDKLYEGLDATERHVHSELVRVEHLPYLRELRVGVFDPSADQYLNPRILRDKCPCRFTARIMSWHVRDMSARELQDLYREYASCGPASISFSMSSLAEEPKMKALLEVARELR